MTVTVTCDTCHVAAHGPTVETAARFADIRWHGDPPKRRECAACRRECDCWTCDHDEHARTICRTCWLEKSVSGACGCEEGER